MSAATCALLSGAWRVTRRNLLVWRSMALASAVGHFGEPLLYLVALGFGLGRVVPDLDGMSYAEFIAPGLVVSTAMYTATFECTFGSYTRLAVQGTYDAILATPIGVAQVALGEVLYAGIKSAFGGAIVLAVAAGFGLVPSPWAPLVVLVAFVSGLVFGASALVVSAVSKSYEVFNYYFTLAVAPMYLFCGVFFPIGHMPPWVKSAAEFLPLTHAVELSRALIRGHVGPGLLAHLAILTALVVPAYFLATKQLEKRLVR